MLKNYRNGRVRGFSLVELLIVLVVIAVIVAIVIGRGKSTNADGRAQQEADMTAELFTGMIGLKSGGTYGTAGADLTPAMIAKGRMPVSYNVTGTTAQNTYNGSVTFSSSGGTAVMTQNSVPPEGCVAMIHKVSQLGMGTITANGTNLGSASVPDSTATTACNKTGQANVVSIQSLM